MSQIDVPDGTLIADDAQRTGGFADSFVTRVPGTVPLPVYVEAFYTSRLFRAERVLLGLAGHPSTDTEARAVAEGSADRIAVWGHPVRRGDELLMPQLSGATASWFMTRSVGTETELCFGTIVRPGKSGAKRMPWVYRALSGFHRLYSRLLLASAARRVRTVQQG